MSETGASGANKAKDWRIEYAALNTSTGLAAFIGLMLMTIGFLLIAGLYFPPPAKKPPVFAVELLPEGKFWVWALPLCAGWGLFQGARTHAIVRRLNNESKPSQIRARRQKSPQERELFIYLAMSLIGLVIAAAAASNDAIAKLAGLSLAAAPVLNRTVFLPGVMVLFVLLLAAFLPAAYALYHQEKRRLIDDDKLNNLKTARPLFRRDAISWASVAGAVIAIVIIWVIALAASSGLINSVSQSSQNRFGIFVTVVVMAIFTFFIVLTTVRNLLRQWTIQKSDPEPEVAGSEADQGSESTVTGWISVADSALVRLIGPLTGATQIKWGHHGIGWHHLIIVAVMSSLSLLGFLLPQPNGLFPIAIAFLLTLAVGRRWAWIEGDRETASRLQRTHDRSIHIGFGNEMRDEAMLCYAFLFLLVPMALYQINDMTRAFDDPAGQGFESFFNWIGFFGLQLLKAVPIVDWAEIYKVPLEPSIKQATDKSVEQLSNHLLFSARVLVDFVVMGALFQAISLWQRSRTQKQLYNAGQLDIFDPIMEEEFFSHGMRRATEEESIDAQKGVVSAEYDRNPVVQGTDERFYRAHSNFLLKVEAHVDNQAPSGIRWPYSKMRLDRLVGDVHPEVSAGARWMVKKYRLLAGALKDQFKHLNDRWTAGYLDGLSKDDRFSERQSFEILMRDALKTPGLITTPELGFLARFFAHAQHHPEFQPAVLTGVEMLGLKSSNKAVAVLALCVMDDDDRGAYAGPYRLQLDDLFSSTGLLPFGLDALRSRAYESIGAVSTNAQTSASARTFALAVLKHMQEREANKSKTVISKALTKLADLLQSGALKTKSTEAELMTPAETNGDDAREIHDAFEAEPEDSELEPA